MNKRIMAFMLTGLVLALGFTTHSYAEGREDIKSQENPAEAFINQQSNSINSSMTELMKNNGFKDMAKAMESRDYNSMDNYMKNISDKDYDSMINIMNENGYQGMADTMKSIGRDNMIKMHYAMGGAQMMNINNFNENNR